MSVTGSPLSWRLRSDIPATTSAVQSPSGQMTLDAHLELLSYEAGADDELGELQTAPLFTEAVRQHASSMPKSLIRPSTTFAQYGLLAGQQPINGSPTPTDPRIFYNIAAPSSIFICGSQGSGKSHTLSCLLENCLVQSRANILPRPLTGIVFHFDTLTSDIAGQPCEAAYVSSNTNVKVRVLCAPTSFATVQRIYSGLKNVKVERLRLSEGHLNTNRMMDLMAVASGSQPLYIYVVQRILRDLRLEQQASGAKFNYAKFKRALDAEDLTDMQRVPLKQRLDTLESFMLPVHTGDATRGKKMGLKKARTAADDSVATDWRAQAGQLTIVDLSCPCVTADMACLLFKMCLELFLEQPTDIGRVVALDEAHKYMTESAECGKFTETLLTTIRLQRHLAARVFISTQEPTISHKLLDLCSVTIVHRFSSPAWFNALGKHLAGLHEGMLADGIESDQMDDSGGVSALAPPKGGRARWLFDNIIALSPGQALVFAPSAITAVDKTAVKRPFDCTHDKSFLKRLGQGVLKVRVRKRLTSDGGQSIMAA